MLPNLKEFRCFGGGGKEFFRRRGSVDGLFLGGMMRRRIVPVFLFVAAVFTPLLVSADSDFSVRDEAAGFFDGAVDEARRYARDELIFGESAVDFSEWLARHGELTFNEVVMAPLVRGGVDYVEGLGFVRDVEVRYESPLGERAGNFGFGALGSFRESADDVVVWELRGFIGEDDVAGANVGAAYRRLLSDDFLAGVNAFLDYERGGDLSDESFWRWSAGVEATGADLDFSANRYWALSDAVMATVGGEVFRVYSADGWDAQLRGRVAVRYPVAFRFLDSAEVAARYYVWEGDGDAGAGGGDADVSGARYRLGFVPLPQLRFGVEYDDGDGGGKNFGYYVNFRHRLGAASDSVLRDDGADVWSRRFDPVRREHQQHIMRTQAGAGVVTSVEIYLSTVSVSAAMVTLVPINLSASYSYVVASANPLALANSVTVDSGGVVSYAGIVAGGVGGNVVFELTPVAGGAAVSVSVFFRDLAIPDNPNFNSDGELPILLSEFAVSATLFTVTADGALSQKFAIVESRSAAWANLLAIDENSGEVTDAGLVRTPRNGVVVFSVTDADGAVVFLTVRFGGLTFADVALTLNSLDANMAVYTLAAVGGDGVVTYASVSFEPTAWNTFLIINSDGEVIDSGAAAGGAATATVMVAATDGADFKATAAMVVEVLDDVSIAGSVDVVITPGNENGPVYTLAAMGGDGNYTYAWVSANPSDWQDSTLVITGSVVSGVDAAAGGAVSATAVFSATDGIGAMTVFVTAYIEVVESATFVSDNLNLTLTSDDSGEVLTLSVVVGDGSHSFAVHSTDSFSALFMIAEGANGHGIITDNGAIAAGADSGEVVFSLTDNGVIDYATVNIVVYDDIALADDDITVTVNSADADDPVVTLTAAGGDGTYNFSFVSANPSGSEVSLSTAGSGAEFVITDNGIAAGGAATATLEYKVTDGSGMEATATVEIIALADVGFVADDLTVTVASTDNGAMVLTLTATGGDGSYTYAAVSGDPSGWENSLAIGNSNGIITDSGAAADRAATASVVFTATDGSGLVASATVEVIAVADLVVSAVDITVSLNSGSVGDVVLTLTASGGLAPLSYAVVSANPAAWMSGGLLALNNGVVTHNNLATAVGDGTVVFAVTDALGRVVNAAVNFNYTAVKFTARHQHAAVVFNNKIYIIGGTDGSGTTDRLDDVWSSSDGLNWVLEVSGAFPGRQGHAAVVHDNKIFVIGGATDAGFLNRANDVWSSGDGVNWTQQTPAATHFDGRAFFRAAALNGTMYVAGGQNSSLSRVNDVWYSTDGATWTEATDSAGFSAREFFAMTTLNNSLYVSGGDAGSRRRDVWSSADGASWTRDTNAAGFSARDNHAVVALGSEMFVIGGFDGSNNLRDVWSSTDGASWTEETASAAFPARRAHAAVAFNGRIYVLGGRDNSNFRNDVWSSADGVTWTQH